jgi:hypothetical protein
MRLLAAFCLACFASVGHAADAPSDYVPQPVWCASGGSALCATLPSFIGPDPALDSSVGYSGIGRNIPSFAEDAQTPFDNMAWQMFVALNWQAGQGGGDPKRGLAGSGPALWQTWSRPEDVFGGPPPGCPNPDDLPRFNLIAKSDAQGGDEEFLQATGQPLIDVAGNWTLFERRLNDVEKNYLVGNGLDSLAGQQAFVLSGQQVALPIGEMPGPAGAPGAIEVKAAWRIIDAADSADYFSQRALLDVEGKYVADGAPLCQEVTLGLVGLHLIQNNGAQGNLRPQFIWASFEHVDNAPFAQAACDPTDPNCYKTIANNACPVADEVSGTFSYWNAACRAAGVNVPPALKSGQQDFVWQRTPPYAGGYTTTQGGVQCGTQVSHCWQVYYLTQQLNTAWRAQLAVLGSPFRHYYLIGTNWGGNVEPDGTQLDNGSVPAFLANGTMETYIQADPQFGNCVGCHQGATLAYTQPGKDPQHPKTFGADFSFLPGLATRTCADLKAGPIWDDGMAQTVCPKTCAPAQLQWNGQWTTTEPGTMSVCGCCLPAGAAQ